jgi:hypothetical protein
MRNALFALFMSVGMIAVTPSAMRAEEHHREVRYYDRDAKDYHAWNENEARAYRHWLMEERRNARYHDYARAKAAEQREYWRWRHAHQDWH